MPPEITSTSPKLPDTPKLNQWKEFWRIIRGPLASGFFVFLIAPYLQFDDNLYASFIFAGIATTLHIFTKIIIYLYANKEDLDNELLSKFTTQLQSLPSKQADHQKRENQPFLEILTLLTAPISSILIWIISPTLVWLFPPVSTRPPFPLETSTIYNFILTVTTFIVVLTPPALVIKTKILNSENMENHEKNFKKIQSTQNPQEKPAQKHTPLDQVKYIISLSPVIISLSFIIVLMYYKDTLGNDVEIALRITSLKLPQNQQTWIAETFILITVIYLTILPSILLLPSSKFGAHLVFNEETVKKYKNWDVLYRYACIQLAIYTFPPTLLLCFILNTISSDSAILYLAGSLIFSFSLGQIAIGYSMLKTIKLEKEITLHKVPIDKQTWISSLAIVSLLLLPITSGIIYTQSVYQDLGRLIADPGNSNTDSTNPFSCVFSGTRENPTPKLTGIIISANASSIHILTPSFNPKDKKYEDIKDTSHLSTERLTEYHIEIKEYYFERFNPSKHEYNDKTGTCEYKKDK